MRKNVNSLNKGKNKMARFGAWLWNLCRICGFVFLALLIIAAFSDRISPLFCVWFAYLGLFFPFILLLNILFALLFITGKKWKTVFLYAAVFLICSSAIKTYLPVHFKDNKVPENTVKFLSYNVRGFDCIKKNLKGKENSTLNYIAEIDADIVCLQEYASIAAGGKFLNDSDIASKLKKLPYRHIEPLNPANKTSTYAVAIFSKFPIRNVERLPKSSRQDEIFAVEVDVNGKTLTIINNHLQSNHLSTEDRTGFYDLTVNPNTEKIESFTHTMFRRLTPAYKKRTVQANMIADYIKTKKPQYLIVCGDFNDTPISYVRRKIKGDLHDAFAETGCGLGITYNMHRFLFRIDHILHSENIKAYNCTVGNQKYSDHYPVWCWMRMSD
jgi:endonuclease/exonuclease/phosphatase family metal-dependent hydrolase